MELKKSWRWIVNELQIPFRHINIFGAKSLSKANKNLLTVLTILRRMSGAKVKHETAPKNKKMIHDGSPEEAKTSGLFSFER